MSTEQLNFFRHSGITKTAQTSLKLQHGITCREGWQVISWKILRIIINGFSLFLEQRGNPWELRKEKNPTQPPQTRRYSLSSPKKKKRNKTLVLCQYLKNYKLRGQRKHSLAVWNIPGKPTEQLTLKNIVSKTNQHGFTENSFLQTLFF